MKLQETQWMETNQTGGTKVFKHAENVIQIAMESIVLFRCLRAIVASTQRQYATAAVPSYPTNIPPTPTNIPPTPNNSAQLLR